MGSLSEAKLKELRSECFAEDVEIDMAKLSLLSEAEARRFFESGGKELPPAPPVAPQAASGAASSADDDVEAKVLALKNRGNDQLKSGDLGNAISAYREAIGLAPSGFDASALHSNLSMALLKQGDGEASLAAAEACVAAKPSWHKAHYRKGEALFEMGRYEEALTAYETALEMQPGDADIVRATKLTKEAIKGGVWMRQLLPGRDIALHPSSQMEGLIFGSAKSMQNFIYLVGDARSRECYAVDTAWDPKGIAAFAKTHKMKLVGAIATHYHFDHIGGAIPPQFAAMVTGPFGNAEPWLPGLKEMGKEHGCKLYCHASERERIAKQLQLRTDELTPLEQGGRLPLGPSGGHIEVFHTPGHSGGSICLCARASEGAAAHSLYVGDTIFPGSCGRLDLPDSDKAAMYDSLQVLKAMDDSLQVFPGHAYSGPSTTIGQEKRAGLLRDFSKQQWLSMHG